MTADLLSEPDELWNEDSKQVWRLVQCGGFKFTGQVSL